MSGAALENLATELREHPSFRSKLAIADAIACLGVDAGSQGRPGDDAAILPRSGGGYDLLAGEGFIPSFLAADPWFAGWSGAMVNISDIAAMGGRAVGLVDQIWAPSAQAARPVLDGLKMAAHAYGVPLVGGHTNFAASELNLAVSVFGRAQALITSFDAQPGDCVIAAIDQRGAYRNFDNFFAAGDAPAQRLRDDLALLPECAELGEVASGKDISQGGIIGTALMLAECSGVGIDIDLHAIKPPTGVELARWLRSFPSFGFLLCAAPERAGRVIQRFQARDIQAEIAGRVVEGSQLRIASGDASVAVWDHASAPYLGVSAKRRDDKELTRA